MSEKTKPTFFKPIPKDQLDIVLRQEDSDIPLQTTAPIFPERLDWSQIKAFMNRNQPEQKEDTTTVEPPPLPLARKKATFTPMPVKTL